MSKRDMLKVVEVIEESATHAGWSEDHSEGVVANAFRRLAEDLGAAFGIPGCECGRYDECGTRNPDCPRVQIRESDD